MNIIKSLPTPIAGLALGSVALGNLLQPYSSSLQLLFNLLSLIIIVLLTIKFTLGFDELKKEMKNPPHFVWGGLRIIDSSTYTITSMDGYKSR